MYILSMSRAPVAVLLCMSHCTQLSCIFIYLTSRYCNATVNETLYSALILLCMRHCNQFSCIFCLSHEPPLHCYYVWDSVLRSHLYIMYLKSRCYNATVYEILHSALIYILSISRAAAAVLLCMSHCTQLSCIFIYLTSRYCIATVYETLYSALMYILSISRAAAAVLLCLRHCTLLSFIFCLSHEPLLQCYCVWDTALSSHVYYISRAAAAMLLCMRVCF
jgi:hypothetical protein